MGGYGRKDWSHFVPEVRARFDFPGCLDLRLIRTLEELEAALANPSPFMAWDTETEGLDFVKHGLVGFSFAFDSHSGYYVPVRHHSEPSLGKPALDRFYNRLLQLKAGFVFNMRFDYRMMEAAGYDIAKVPYFDVQVSVHLADPDCKEISLKKSL